MNKGTKESKPGSKSAKRAPTPTNNKAGEAKLYITLPKELSERFEAVVPRGLKTKLLVSMVEQVVELVEGSDAPTMLIGAIIDKQGSFKVGKKEPSNG